MARRNYLSQCRLIITKRAHELNLWLVFGVDSFKINAPLREDWVKGHNANLKHRFIFHNPLSRNISCHIFSTGLSVNFTSFILFASPMYDFSVYLASRTGQDFITYKCKCYSEKIAVIRGNVTGQTKMSASKWVSWCSSSNFRYDFSRLRGIHRWCMYAVIWALREVHHKYDLRSTPTGHT